VNVPSLPVVALNVCPVFSFLIVTDVFGSTAPLGSVKIPEIAEALAGR
jgi:hypothetical protein